MATSGQLDTDTFPDDVEMSVLSDALTQPLDPEISQTPHSGAESLTISHSDAISQIISYLFKCDICQAKFTDQFGFFEHLKNHYDGSQAQTTTTTTTTTTATPVVQPLPNPVTVTTAKPPPRKRTRLANKGKGAEDKAKESPNQNSKSFACLKCGKEFKRKFTLTTHLKNIHGGSEAEGIMIIQAGNPSDVSDNTHQTQFQNEIIIEGEQGGCGEELLLIKNESDMITVEEFNHQMNELAASEDVEVKHEVVATTLIHCHKCGDTFETEEGLAEHFLEEHGSSDGEDEELESERNSKQKLAETTKNGKDTMKCSECDRVFNHRNSLVYHMRSHTGERPHTCDLCGKSFFASSALKVHKRLHSGEKPYSCEHCGRCFRQWGDLTYHVISIHSDIRQYQCEFCGKDFARKYSLVVHRRIHTGERNYKCDFCEKSFRAASYLQNHRRIHTGEKPHECSICGKPFRVRSDMKRHMSSHTREKERRKAEAVGTDSEEGTELDPSSPAKATKSASKTKVDKSTPTASKTTPNLTGTRSSTRVSAQKRKPNAAATAPTTSEQIIHQQQEIVAVNEAGEIIHLDPELARQLQQGQLIQVPTSGPGSIRLTHGGGLEDSLVITGDIDSDQVHVQVEESVTEIKDELIYEEEGQGQPIAISQGSICDGNSGTLYVWPLFMSGN